MPRPGVPEGTCQTGGEVIKAGMYEGRRRQEKADGQNVWERYKRGTETAECRQFADGL